MVLGISINDLGILYLWVLAVLLMLINPRFLCFSYAGGLLALFSLFTGYPKLNIPALMGLVAVLHLVESALILASGHSGSLPVYVRNRFGRVVGAFNLQKFWPVPLAIIAIGYIGPQLPRMPGWWPLLGTGCPLGACSRSELYLPSFQWWLPWATGNWPSPACPGSGSGHLTAPGHLQFAPAGAGHPGRPCPADGYSGGPVRSPRPRGGHPRRATVGVAGTATICPARARSDDAGRAQGLAFP